MPNPSCEFPEVSTLRSGGQPDDHAVVRSANRRPISTLHAVFLRIEIVQGILTALVR